MPILHQDQKTASVVFGAGDVKIRRGRAGRAGRAAPRHPNRTRQAEGDGVNTDTPESVAAVLVRHFDTIDQAIRYAEEVSRRGGPLDNQYAEVARILRAREVKS